MSLVSMFVFPAPQSSYTMHSFPNELLWIPCGPTDGRPADAASSSNKPHTGNAVPAVILRSPAARFLIIYFHSNGEDIGLAYPFGCGLRMVLEVHVLLVEYPGYGICPGECSEEGLWEIAQAAFRFATETLRWPLEDVIIMGRSLGAAVAMRLACHYACHGLILVAPFLSLVEAVSQYVGNLAPFFVGNSFCNRDLIRQVRLPTLVIHGVNDRLVACTQGRQLWEMCPHKKKLLVCPEQMSHNSDLLSNADFLIRPMLRFFALPDYSFVDLEIPAEAFDKRQCPQYHKLIEMSKNDAPLARPQGDEEPCPVGDTMTGPHSCKTTMAVAGGDTEDIDDGSEEHTVQDKVPVLISCAQEALPQDIHRLHQLAAEIGLRLPDGVSSPQRAAASDPLALDHERSAPMAELTNEMLSGLSAFLHGAESPSEPSDIHAARSNVGKNPQSRYISGPANECPPHADLDVDLGTMTGSTTVVESPGGTTWCHQVESPDTAKSSSTVPSTGLTIGGSSSGLPVAIGGIEVDPVPEEQDEDWAVHAAKEPVFMCHNQPQSSERPRYQDHRLPPPRTLEEESMSTPTLAGAEDAARLSEEGSTAVPLTPEASGSRWSEPASDPDCKAMSGPGVSDAISLSISRFLNESDNANSACDSVNSAE